MARGWLGTGRPGAADAFKARRIALMAVGVFSFSLGQADGLSSTDPDAEGLQPTLLAPGTLSAGSSASPWRLSRPPSQTNALSEGRTPPIVEFDVRRSNALRRVGHIRRLSLLTLGKRGRTRLFLGVNDEGLPGLHIIVTATHDDDRILEIARMPYIKDTDLKP